MIIIGKLWVEILFFPAGNADHAEDDTDKDGENDGQQKKYRPATCVTTAFNHTYPASRTGYNGTHQNRGCHTYKVEWIQRHSNVNTSKLAVKTYSIKRHYNGTHYANNSERCCHTRRLR
jgi:hypothetical protein